MCGASSLCLLPAITMLVILPVLAVISAVGWMIQDAAPSMQQRQRQQQRPGCALCICCMLVNMSRSDVHYAVGLRLHCVKPEQCSVMVAFAVRSLPASALVTGGLWHCRSGDCTQNPNNTKRLVSSHHLAVGVAS